MNHTAIRNLLEGLLSNDNKKRIEATQSFQDLLKSSPNEVIHMLLQLLKTTEENEILLQCILMIKYVCKSNKSSPKGNTALMARLLPYTKEELKEELPLILRNTIDDAIRTNLCELICEIAKQEENMFASWPSLRNNVVEMMSASEPHNQRSCLLILGRLCDKFRDDFGSGEVLLRIVNSFMGSEDLWVKCDCAGFIADVLQHGWFDECAKLEHLPHQILVSLEAACKQKHPCNKDFLESIISITELHLDFFKNYLDPFCNLLWSFASDQGLEDTIQRSCAEILLCIAEFRPRLAYMIPYFVKNTCEILLKFMLNITDEELAEWFEKDETSIEHEVSDSFVEGEEGLDRLAKAFEEVDDNVVLNQIINFVNASGHSDWRYKFVGIMAISQTIEYILERRVLPTLDMIIPFLLEHLKDEDFRIRFAACQAIGQISLDHQPLVQKTYYAQVLPELVKSMDDPNNRVVTNATAAFINFAEEVSKPVLLPYADFLMGKFIARITEPQAVASVRQQAISAIAVIAAIVEKHFLKYFETIMPVMMSIICESTSEDDKTLRGKAIECVSIIGMSIGAEAFEQYGVLIMHSFIKIRNDGFDVDDPVEEYVEQALSRMCRALKSRYVVFLPQIMPGILDILRMKVEDGEWEDDSDEEDGNFENDTFHPSDPDKYVVLFSQWRAIDLVDTFAEVLQENFRDYLKESASALLNILASNPPDYVVRKTLVAIVSLISAAKANAENGNHDTTFVAELFSNVVSHILPYFECEKLRDDLAQEEDISLCYVSILNDAILKAGPSILTVKMIKTLASIIFQLLRDCEVFIVKKSNAIQACKDLDIRSEMEKSISQEENICSLLVDILGSLMKHYPNEYNSEVLSETVEIVNFYFSSEGTRPSKLLALYLCDDFFEHLKGANGMLNDYLPEVLKYLTSEDAALRQAASYAVGRACSLEGFDKVAENVITPLSAAASMTSFLHDQTMKDAESATDNAVAALGYCIFLHHSCIPNVERLLQGWLDYLPLKQDDSEGKFVHADLMRLVEQKDPHVLGPSGENIGRIVSIFARIYESSFSTPEIDEKIRLFMSEVGKEKLSDYSAALSEADRQVVQTIFAELELSAPAKM